MSSEQMKKIGLVNIIGLGVGSAIGSGIFVTLGSAIGMTGRSVLVVTLIGVFYLYVIRLLVQFGSFQYLCGQWRRLQYERHDDAAGAHWIWRMD